MKQLFLALQILDAGSYRLLRSPSSITEFLFEIHERNGKAAYILAKIIWKLTFLVARLPCDCEKECVGFVVDLLRKEGVELFGARVPMCLVSDADKLLS